MPANRKTGAGCKSFGSFVMFDALSVGICAGYIGGANRKVSDRHRASGTAGQGQGTIPVMDREVVPASRRLRLQKAVAETTAQKKS